jgi:hypothetical protein
MKKEVLVLSILFIFGLNFVSPSTVTVDSTYHGYSTSVIDDGIIDAYGYETTTWASNDGIASPHWILIEFSQSQELSSATLHWTYDVNLDGFMTSQHVDVQVWDGSQYNIVATMAGVDNTSSTTVTFPALTTQRLRFWQPAGQGPLIYQGVFWITEADYTFSTTSFCGDNVCNGTETSVTCPADCPATTYFGDLNHDGKISISDIMIIMRHILNRETNWESDVDEDGEVNIFDLVKVARIWGKQYETDTTPPSILSGIPSQNILPLGTTTAIVGVETDERATCRYNPTPTDFASMTAFDRTGGIQHTKEETGLQDDSNYLYFVQCQDEAGNLNSTDYLINFSVGSYGGGTSFCGDGVCNGTETSGSCLQDCPVATPYCGDTNCDANESCSSCEADCGVCAPPGSDEPQPPANEIPIQNFNEGDLASGDSYLYESFDRYGDAQSDIILMAANNNYFASPRTAYVTDGTYSIVPGRGGSGYAVRTYYDGIDKQADWRTPHTWGVGGGFGNYDESRALITQFWFRWPDANGIMNGGKFFDMMYNDNGDRIQFSIKTGDPRKWSSNAGDATKYEAPGYSGREIGHQPIPPYPDAQNDGNWYRATVAYKTNSASFSRDGFFRAWVDGTKIVDVSNDTIGVTPPNGTEPWCDGADVDSLGTGFTYQIDFFRYPNYVNGLTAPFNIDFDDIKVWTE